MVIIEQKEKVILKMQNALISANVSQYHSTVMALLSRENLFDELELDISETENIDSFGVSFIISLYKSCLHEGKQFKVSGSSEDIINLFKLMKLDEFFELN